MEKLMDSEVLEHCRRCKSRGCSTANQLRSSFLRGEKDEVSVLKATNDLLTLIRRGKEPDDVCLASLPHLIVDMMWINATRVKVVRKLVQILMYMDKLCHTVVDKALDCLWRRVSDSVWGQQAISVDSVGTEETISEDTASIQYQASSSTVYLFLLCNVLEVIKFTPSFLIQDVVTQILKYTCTELLRECACTEAWTVARQRRMYMMNKVLLQFCQTVVSLDGAWGALKQASLERILAPDYCDDESLPVQCLRTAWRVLGTESTPKDCQLLAGSTVAYLLTAACDTAGVRVQDSGDTAGVRDQDSGDTAGVRDQDSGDTAGVWVKKSVRLFLQLFHNLSVSETSGASEADSTSESLLNIGRSAEACKAFGHLSLVNGLMSYAPAEYLLHSPDVTSRAEITHAEISSHSPDGSSNNAHVGISAHSPDVTSSEPERLLDWALDVITDLCSTSRHKYHAFKLLELFYKRITREQQLLPFMSGRTVEGGGSSLRRTLRLILTNVDSPVDGVDGSSTSVLSLLLQHRSVSLCPASNPSSLSPASNPSSLSPASNPSSLVTARGVAKPSISSSSSAEPCDGTTRHTGSRSEEEEEEDDFLKLHEAVESAESMEVKQTNVRRDNHVQVVDSAEQNSETNESSNARVEGGGAKSSELVDWLLTDLSSMAWHVRARYLLWAVFIQHMSIDKLVEHCCRELIEDISRCLSTNYLTPPAMQVYQGILSKLMAERNGLSLWKEFCWASLRKALHDPTDSLLCRNASQQWLIGTLRTWPATLSIMLDDLSAPADLSAPTDLSQQQQQPDSSQLYAALVVLCAAKSYQIECKVKPPLSWLERAVVDSDNNIRLTAFSYMCTSARKTEYLSPDYLHLLTRSLPHNMNIDVPAFRKQLQSYVLGALVRVRDSSLAELRVAARTRQLDRHAAISAHTGSDTQVDNQTLAGAYRQVERGRGLEKETRTERGREKDTSKGRCGDITGTATHSAELLASIEFVDWCWRHCMHSLVPGSNYQRLYTALLWARTLMDTFESRPHQSQRKGCVPVDVKLLIDAARSRSLCHFFTRSAFNSLTSCLLHTIDEIREMSADILMLYFPWSSPSVIGSGDSDDLVSSQSETACRLLATGLSLCNSTRADDCDSGALMISIVYNKCIVECGRTFSIKHLTGDWSVEETREEPCVTKEAGLGTVPAVEFITELLSHIDTGLSLAAENTLRAAQQRPMHGFLLAVRRCLMVTHASVLRRSVDEWRRLILRIIGLTTRVFQTALTVFGGVLDWNDRISAPSFEKMGESIRDAITASLALTTDHQQQQQCGATECGGGGGGVEALSPQEAVLTIEYQQVSTWCWLNLREGSLLLGHMSDVVLRSDAAHLSDSLLSYSSAENIGQLFLKVLTGCRHRGAIESSSVGFDLFCAALMKTGSAEMNKLPELILLQVFDLIHKSTDLSVTRRAAGFPLIVQAILGNEAKLKQSILLKRSVDHFLSILSPITLSLSLAAHHNNVSTAVHLSQPAGLCAEVVEDSTAELLGGGSTLGVASDETVRQQYDIPQVHCLHMLKALVHDAGLSGETGPYVEALTISAIDGFKSPEWAVRNANIHLLGSLLSKLLGEKKTRAEDMLTMTAGEFCIQYPALSQHMLSIINQAALQLVNDSSLTESLANRIPNASLFPVLVILTRLTPGMELAECEKLLAELRHSLSLLAHSSLYAVRQLGAKALVPLVPRHCAIDHAHTVALQLPSSTKDMKFWKRLQQQRRAAVEEMGNLGGTAAVSDRAEGMETAVSSKQTAVSSKQKADWSSIVKNGVGFNTLHGQLLQIQQLIGSIADSYCSNRSIEEGLRKVLTSLEDRLWILSPSNPCSLTRFTFLRLYAHVFTLCPHATVSVVVDGEVELVIRAITSGQSRQEICEIGESSLVDVCVRFWLRVALQQCQLSVSRDTLQNKPQTSAWRDVEEKFNKLSLDNTRPPVSVGLGQGIENESTVERNKSVLTSRLVECLSSGNSEVVLSSLQWLCDESQTEVCGYIEWTEIEPLLWSLALNKRKADRELVCSALDLLFLIQQHSDNAPGVYQQNSSPDSSTVWPRLLSLIGGGFNMSASAAALKLSAVVLRDAVYRSVGQVGVSRVCSDKASCISTNEKTAARIGSTCTDTRSCKSTNSGTAGVSGANEERQGDLQGLSGMDVSGWIGVLEERGDARQTSTMRLSSAQALNVAAPYLIPLRAMPLTDILRLVKLTLRQLYDEDVAVRQIACDTVLQLTNHNSLNLSSRGQIHFNYATRMLLSFAVELCENSAEFAQELYGWLVICDEESDSLSLLANDRRPELFEAEDANPFSELDRFQLDVLTCLLTLKAPGCSQWLRTEAQALSRLFNTVTKLLQSNSQDLLLMSSSKNIYEFLHSLLCRHAAISHWLRDLAQCQGADGQVSKQPISSADGCESGWSGCLQHLSDSYKAFAEVEFSARTHLLESFHHRQTLLLST